MAADTAYTSDKFPFAALFAGLTNYAQHNSCTPIDLYVRYQRERRRMRLTPCPDYASTSITSGGHAHRPDMEIQQIIAANTRTARQMVALMDSQGALDREAVILPVDLGHVPGWRQSDYIEFWLLVIGGLNLGLQAGNARMQRFKQALSHALEQHGVDLAVMNDFAQTAAERAPQYFRYADAFVQAADLSGANRDATPVRKIVSLVDPHVSLGGQTERYFARTVNIPVYLPAPVQPAEQLSDAVTIRSLARDMATIIRFGGTVCQITTQPILICVRDSDQERPPVLDMLRGGTHAAKPPSTAALTPKT